MSDGRVRIGTSGWNYRGWRGAIYPADLPARRWLESYSERFDTVEVNGTFYRLQDGRVFESWRKQAPEGFLFAVKASRFLTHNKKLKDPEEPLERLLSRARRLGDMLGPILYQLPPRWKLNIDRLREFLDALPDDAQHVFEFREQSWFDDSVRRLLDDRGMGFCIHDMHGLDCPKWVTGGIAYLRFHGPSEQKYSGSYSDDQLRGAALEIRRYRDDDRTVFAYFNNDIGGHAIRNALTLREMAGDA